MLNTAVTLDPNNPLAHFLLGLMYERESNSEKSQNEFRETGKLLELLRSREHGTRDRIDGNIYYDKVGNAYHLGDLDARLQRKLHDEQVRPH